MSELIATFMDEIVSTLNSTRFSVDDFDLEGDEDKELLRIVFKYNDSYSFILTEDSVTEEVESTNPFRTGSISKTVTKLFSYESPSSYKKTEKIEIRGFENVCDRIAKWCLNLHKELSAETSDNSEYEQAKTAFKEQFEINIDDPESRFSEKEVSALQLRLDELYQKFEELSEKHQISEEELEKLNGEIEKMKDNAHTYKKGIWAKITQNKVTELIFTFLKSKEGRELVIDSIKHLGN